MAVAGVLEVQMMADLARISKDMSDAKRIVGDAAGGMSNSLLAIKNSIEASLSPLQQLTVKVGSLESQMSKAKDAALSMGKTLLLGAAAGMSIDAIKDKIVGVINSMATLKTLSEKTGSSVENLSKLGFIAKQSGSDIDAVTGAINKLSKGMAGADNETKGAGMALSYLGVSAKDAAGNLKDPAVMFTEIAKKLGEYQDGAGKAAIAQALFGKAGADMLPTLKLLGEQGDMVAKVTDAQATAARQYARDIAKLDGQKNALFKTVAIALLPVMTDFVNVLIDASKETNMANAAAKSLASDNSITNWADAGAMGLARLIDVIKILPNLFTALKGSFGAVLADIEFVGRSAAMLNPISMATKIGRGENPVGDLTLFLNQRNKTLEDANAAYSTLWTMEGNATEQAMAKRIAARTADRAAMTADDAARKALEASKPKLNYNTAGEDAGGSSAGIKAEQNAYAGLIATIREKIEADKQALTNSTQATESQKLRIKVDQEMASGKLKLTDAHKIEIAAGLDSLAMLEKQIKTAALALQDNAERLKISEELDAAYVAESKSREQGRQVVADYAKSVNDSNDVLQYEFSLMGLSAQARSIALDQYRVELELKKQIAVVNSNGGFDEAQREEERNRLRAAAAIAKAGVSGKVMLDDWKASVGQYDDIFRKGFSDMVNGGKGTWKSFTQSLVTTFKTSVADQIYKMFAQPFVVKLVGSMLGLTGGAVSPAASAATGGSDAISMASTLGSLGSGVGLLGAGGLGLQAGFGALMTGGFAGVSAAVSGGLAAIGLGTGAGIAAGLGVIAGALGPIALAAFAVYALMGKGDSRFGSQYDYNSTTGNSVVGGPNAGVDFNGQSAAQNSTITGINTILSTLGSSAFVNRFTSGFESSENGKGFSYAGGVLSSGGAFGQGVDGNGYNNNRGSMTPEQAQASYIKELKQATLQALQAATDIPQSISSALAGLNIDGLTDDALNQLMNNIDAQISAASGLRQALNLLPMDQLRDVSMKTAFALAEASGGFAALGTKLASYYDNYYTAEEKRAQTVKNINAATAGSGLDAATATRESFRKIVESQDLTTVSGQKTYASLLSVAGAFAELEKISQTMANLQKERTSLRANLLDAQGDKGAANAIRRTEAITGFSAAEIAAYDYNRALEAQVVAVQAATAAAQVTASERAGLQGQLDQLTMTSAELLNKQRDALNSSNRALFDQVQAATAAQAAAQQAAAITQQRGQMEITVMQLQGNAAGALAAQRKLELAALDASLRPLQSVIYGLQDIATAAQAAATAANVAAQAYFAQIDRVRNIATMTTDANAGLDKFFGTTTASSTAALDTANAALDASKTAAANWRGISSTIQSTLDGLRSQTSTLMSNGYESSRAQFASLSALAAGGDAASAGKLSGAASAFLAASDMNSRTLADYLRDRAAVENSLAKTMTIANLQATAQESISASSAAAVSQLTAMNANLTGFSAQVFQLLQNGYRGADRPTATAAATSLAKATADYANYFAQTKEGATREYNGGTLTRLAGDVARFTSASGVVDYLRSSDSVLDTANRVAGFRDQVARQYGLNFPSYDVGTNFVPRDMIAQIHEGEAIVPRAYNPAAGGSSSNDNTAVELKALRADFVKLLASVEQGNKNTQVTAEAMQGQQRRPLLVEIKSA